ncbi:MAG TPA: hypothetical protein PKN75_10820 [Bacteroidia bacterium]|nr:hypothetical protein [Bacteroidia bacterium]HNU34071.1 hypothetical protein [Bacteroidia bacterium]
MTDSAIYLNFLNDVVNIKPRNKKDVIIATISSELFQKSKIQQLIKMHHAFLQSKTERSSKISIGLYSFENSCAERLKSYLRKHLSNDIFGCYVHGSIGTNDTVTYSDFDALVILKDETFSNANRLQNALKHLLYSQKIFFEFDPLQHHGWFVMSEKMLENYPVLFFPPELFFFAKSLFETGRNFSIEYNRPGDYKRPLLNLIDGIERTLKRDLTNYNMFELKSLLSEFMLLPTFYVQAKTSSGIYKKFSFQKASEDFTTSEWEIMNQVSEIRNVWSITFSKAEMKKLSRVGYRNRKYAKANAPKINAAIKKLFNKEMINRMSAFLKIISRKANEL